MSALQVTIGADPEFFLKDRKSGMIVSAHDKVPGTKINPHPLKSGGAIQADGTAVEFNIKPAQTGKEFVKFIRESLKDIESFVDMDKYEFHFAPSVQYDKDYFKTIPDAAKALGCDPDFNAYTLEQNPIYQPPEGVRTGSGHLHFGFAYDQDVKDELYLKSCAHAVKFLDASLAAKEHLWCNDEVRPTLYGKLGNFRPKSYGLEYRTLGNAWLKMDDTRMAKLFDVARETITGLYQYKKNAVVYHSPYTLMILNSKNKAKINSLGALRPSGTNYNYLYL